MHFIASEFLGSSSSRRCIPTGANSFSKHSFANKYRDAGITPSFLQDTHSRSLADTLRGLDLQLRRPQGKLVRVIEGEIYDVAVDVRIGSSTFKRWIPNMLTAESFRQVYVPPGLARRFCVLSPTAQVEYKCTATYAPPDEIGFARIGPALAIDWPVRSPILSARDQTHPPFDVVLEALSQCYRSSAAGRG